MKSFVVIFVPHGEKSADAETAFRRFFDSEEAMIKIPGATPLPDAEDAEQLPLWRWFNF